MNWNDLQDLARAILANKPEGPWKDETFSTGSGTLRNEVNVPIIHRSQQLAYRTTACGDAYRTEISVRCRAAGVKDSRGRDVFEHEDGTLFVFRYNPGSPVSFDCGALSVPTLSRRP